MIIVDGGAGDWPKNLHNRALRGVRRAAEVGSQILGNGSALDAVQAAVVSMEDNPVFYAGTGSALNLLGEIENDAGIMDGESLRGAGVALLKGIKNPVTVARTVMEKPDYVLLAGVSARRLALADGLKVADLRVATRVRAWRQELRRLRHGRSFHSSKNHRETLHIFLERRSDTVGALALDSRGHLAAADSTGGMQLKLPGRIGDSAILGAGIYADSFGAAAATGIGEQAIRLAIAKTACTALKRESAEFAASQSVRLSGRLFGPGMGMITLKKTGGYAAAHNTRDLCWAMKSAKTTRSGMVGSRFLIK